MSIQISTGQLMHVKNLAGTGERATKKGFEGTVLRVYTEPKYCLFPIARVEHIIIQEALISVPR